MRKRSKYRPKGVLLDPIKRVLDLNSLVRTHEGSVMLKLKAHAALDDIVKGQGTKYHLDVLICAMNTAEALYRVNPALGEEYKVELRQAQDALLSMCRRGVAKGRFLFTGEELKAMNLGMELHDAQLDACTLRDLENATNLVTRELKAKRYRSLNDATARTEV